MLLRYTRLYWYFLVQRFKILMEYRVNFLIGASSTFFLQGSSILAIWVVMRQIPSLNGWSFDEVLLVYGLVTLAKSINHMFADNLWTIGRQHIRTGGFDRFLVRPIDPLFHLLADRFCHDGIGNFVTGAVLVGVARTTATPGQKGSAGFCKVLQGSTEFGVSIGSTGSTRSSRLCQLRGSRTEPSEPDRTGTL